MARSTLVLGSWMVSYHCQSAGANEIYAGSRRSGTHRHRPHHSRKHSHVVELPHDAPSRTQWGVSKVLRSTTRSPARVSASRARRFSSRSRSWKVRFSLRSERPMTASPPMKASPRRTPGRRRGARTSLPSGPPGRRSRSRVDQPQRIAIPAREWGIERPSQTTSLESMSTATPLPAACPASRR